MHGIAVQSIMFTLILKTLFILASTTGAWGFLKCKDQLTNSGFVCVCNSEYCDTTPKIPRLNFGSVYQITTAKTLPGFNKKIIRFSEKKFEPKDSNVIVINDEKEYQKLKGFGGSFTDAFGINLLSLSQKTRESLLRSYFDNDGLRYNLCRVPIGGTDFSVDSYTYDDVEGDVYLIHFNLTKEDFLYKIPFIKQANKLRNKTINLLASNWSPPEWMKYKARSNSSYIKDEYYQLYADYQIRFLSEYKKFGLDFWGITPVNEPLTGFFLHLSFNNAIMFPELQAKWIGQYFGPSLKSNGFGSIKIITFDDQRKYVDWWMDLVMADKEAKDYISGVGVHWYSDTYRSPTILDYSHDKYPDKFIIYSEASINRAISSQTMDFGSWSRGALYAHNIIEDLNHWSIGWIDWNMVLDMTGGPTYVGLNCDAPILVDKEKDVFYKQPMYYLLGHFSAFTSENSTRIELIEFNLDRLGQNLNYVPQWPNPPFPTTASSTVTFPDGIYKTATKNSDGSTTIFLLNTYLLEANVTVIDKKRGNLYINLEPESMNSFIYW